MVSSALHYGMLFILVLLEIFSVRIKVQLLLTLFQLDNYIFIVHHDVEKYHLKIY